VNLKEWAASAGVSYTTARRWFSAGKLPVPARKVGGLILVDTGAAAGEIPALAAALLAACARAFGTADALSRAHEAVDFASRTAT
jgi:predicted site-specific integrase-resolvase